MKPLNVHDKMIFYIVQYDQCVDVSMSMPQFEENAALNCGDVTILAILTVTECSLTTAPCMKFDQHLQTIPEEYWSL